MLRPRRARRVNNPDTRNDNVAFFNDVQRGYRQTAFFTSLRFRHHSQGADRDRGNALLPFRQLPRRARSPAASAVTRRARRLAWRPRPTSTLRTCNTKYKGFKSRANVTWHILPDVLAYYTWSQGFRPGAFNRNFACYIPGAHGVAQYCSPLSFTSDNLTNNETRLENGILRPPPAMERRRLSGRLEQRAGVVLRSGSARQCRLRHEWTELPDSRRGDIASSR